MVGVLLGRCTVQLVYHTIATPQPQNILLPLSPWHNNLTMTRQVGGIFGQPMTIAAHLLIGHDLPYWPIHGNWHVLVEMAAKDIHMSSNAKPLGAASLSCTKYKKIFQE
jgi:hypothetical protein